MGKPGELWRSQKLDEVLVKYWGSIEEALWKAGKETIYNDPYMVLLVSDTMALGEEEC